MTIQVDLLEFHAALAAVPQTARRHILLGNGFSRALRDDIFSYTALFEQAKFDTLSHAAKTAFAALDTTDFEVVMRALRSASALIEVYAPDIPELAARLRHDADGLRELLVTTIANNHPDRPGDISLAAYSRCRTFLANFNTIYTLSYDLLLYWAVMQQELEPPLQLDDGFRTPEDGPAEYVTWEVERTNAQSLFYLHGALHIFDAGVEIQKYTWANTGTALIDQIRAALLSNRYPLFVAEGESSQKLARIKHSDFLGRAYRSFSQITGALFIYGHSMAANDHHIIRLIEKNKVSQLFVGLHGDPTSSGNQNIIQRAQQIAAVRPHFRPVHVQYFSAASAHVWN